MGKGGKPKKRPYDADRFRHTPVDLFCMQLGITCSTTPEQLAARAVLLRAVEDVSKAVNINPYDFSRKDFNSLIQWLKSDVYDPGSFTWWCRAATNTHNQASYLAYQIRKFLFA